MKIKLWICVMLLWSGSLTGCQKQKAVSESMEAAIETSAPDMTDTPDILDVPEEPDYSPVIAEGYQFVEGLGIIAPGEPAFYQMDLSSPLEIKNKFASARLVNAVYQDKKVSVHIILKDYTVRRLSQEEEQQVIEKERQNEERSLRGETVRPDDSYFCIDQEKQIYGRSKFQDLQKQILEANGRRGKPAILYGHGIADVGFSFYSSYYEYSGDAYLDDGFYATIMTLIRDRGNFLMKEPEGVYELKLVGFEEPFRFKFSRVPEYDALNEIPGIQEWDGNYVLATGRRLDQQLSVLCHIYPKDGNKIYLTGTELSMTVEDGEDNPEWLVNPLTSYSMPATSFPGIKNGDVLERTFDVAGRIDIVSPKLICRNISVWSDEESEMLTLPIPERREALEERVAFEKGTLLLTRIEKTEETITGVDEHGEEITVPSVYLTVEQETQEKKHHIRTLVALCGGDAIKNGPLDEQYRFRYGARYPEMESGGNPGDWNILGYLLPYREGDTEISVVFWEPSYQWEETLVFPVKMNGVS